MDHNLSTLSMTCACVDSGWQLSAAGANSRGSRLGLSSQGSGAFAVTPLQRLLSPSFITPDNTFRPPTEQAQVQLLSLVGALVAKHNLKVQSVADREQLRLQRKQASCLSRKVLAPG